MRTTTSLLLLTLIFSYFFVSFKSTCTDDTKSISYLNKWDREIPNLDVTDDYESEKNQIKKAKGKRFRFTFGDYVVKSIMGSIEPKLDLLDETKCRIF